MWMYSKYLLAALLLAAAAEAQPAPARLDRAACLQAYQSALALQRAGHLLQAESDLHVCMLRGCGAALIKRCGRRWRGLELDIPSVVPVVIDHRGQPVVDVEVTMEGEVLTARADGRAVRVDPGWHTFVFKAASGATASARFFVAEGQRNQPVEASFPPPAPAPGAR
jgi:hypothetical protein